MKAKFALDLTNDAVALLERDNGGWMRLGDARFDDPDLENRLAALRSLAEARAPTGFVTKLIIPNSQILYFDCQVTGPDQATRRAEIRATLDGRTPYRVDELVFDFSRAGERARVAVAAKVTLEEAEDFARAYGFRPIAHVAAPEPGNFAGEPFFGLVPGHEELLPEGARFDRDQDPVRIAGDATLATPESERPAQSGPTPANLAAASPSAGPEEAQEAPFIAVADDDENGPEPRPVPEAGPEADPVSDLADPVLADPATSADVRPVWAQGPAEGDAAAVGPAEDPVREETAEDTATGSVHADMGDLSEEGQNDPLPSNGATGGYLTAADGMAGRAEESEPPGTSEPTVAEADAATPEADAVPAFQSRRDVAAAVETATTGDEAAARLAAILPRLGGLVGGESSGRRDPIATPPSTGKVRRLTPGRVRPPAPRTLAPAGLRLPAGLVTAGRSPRLLVPLAGVLVAGLVLAWALLPASVPETPQAPEAAIATAPPSPATPAPPPTGPDSAAAPPPRPVDLPVPAVPASAPTAPDLDLAGSDDRLAALPGPSASDAAPPEEAPQMPAPSDDTALATQPSPPPFGALLRYGADGLIVPTEEGVVTPEGFLLVAGRPPRVPPSRPDNLVPPPVVATEAAAALTGTDVAAPPPFADPALAGKPPRARPADLPVPAPTVPADESALPASGGQDAIVALGPPAPPVDPRHAALKPKPRPEAVAAAAAARLAQDEALADAAAAAARAEAEAAEAALLSASRLAVASSRQPAPRSDKARAAADAAATAAAASSAAAAADAPSVDASAVDAALAEAQTAPAEPVAQEPPAAEADTQDVDEPEPEEGIATIPTTRTVAKKSTFANAIDLEEVQLIGVYGSSASRRALVRMPSGGYKKVKLGDRLDGGRVVAIGTNELVYEKKGRTIRLVIMGRG
jgi:hypothetical protein